MSASASTQRVALAALRRFFALLVTRHAVLLNSFDSVQGPRQGDRREGQAALITPAQVRQLLRTIDLRRPVGFRDRAVLGTLAGTGARVGAVSGLRIRDVRDHGDHQDMGLPLTSPPDVADEIADRLFRILTHDDDDLPWSPLAP